MWSASYQKHGCRKKCDPILISCGKPNAEPYQMAAWERCVDHAGRMEIRRAFLKSIYSFAGSPCEWCCIDVMWLQLLKISAESRSCVPSGSPEAPAAGEGDAATARACGWMLILPKCRAGQGMAAAHCLRVNVSYGFSCAALDSQSVVKKSWQLLPKIPPADEDRGKMAFSFTDNSWLPEEDFQVVRSCILSSDPWIFLDSTWNSYGLKAGAVLVWGISSLPALLQLVSGGDAVTAAKQWLQTPAWASLVTRSPLF